MARSMLAATRGLPTDFPPPLDQDTGRGAIPREVRMLFPPGGMNTSNRLYALAPNETAACSNLIPKRDGWRIRNGTIIVGDTTSSVLLHAREFVTSNEVRTTIRWTSTGVEWLDGTTWRAMTGPTLAGNEASRIATTAWGDLLIFSNGLDGMHAINLTTKTYAVIVGAPNASHLCTFNRRVVASVTATGRIQWCVAGDYTNWTSTNLGAGYEDLLSSSDAYGAEQQTAVVPVSDEVAYVIRSGSVWQLSPTRNVESPFAFSRLVSNVGSRWPSGCHAIPGGAVFLSDTGVYTITGNGLTEISAPVRRLFREMDDSTQGFAQLTQQEIRTGTVIYSGIDDAILWSWMSDTAGLYPVMRFDLDTKLWSLHQMNFPVKSMAAGAIRQTGTIGEMSGTIGALSPYGVIGDLGVSAYKSGVLYTRGYDANFTSSRFVARDAPENARTPQSFDASSNGSNGAASTVTLETSLVRSEDPQRNVFVHDVTLTYEIDVRTAGLVDPFIGLSYVAMASSGNILTTAPLPFPTTGRFKVFSVTYPVQIQARTIKFSLNIQLAANLTILDCVFRVSDGARISDVVVR